MIINRLAIVEREREREKGCSKVVSTGKISIYQNSNVAVRLRVLKQKKVQ